MNNEFEFAFTLLSDDSRLAEDVRNEFPDTDVSVGKNFTGGAEIVAFLTANSGTIAAIVGSILGFLATRQGRYQKSSITIGKKQIKLDGYSPEEVDTLMASDAMKRALDAVK